MEVPGTDVDGERAVPAALLAGLVSLLLFAVARGALLVVGTDLSGGTVLVATIEGLPVSLLWTATLLAAVVVVVGSGPNPRAVLAGVAIVLAVELPLAVVQASQHPGPFGSWQRYALVPLDHVVVVLAVATAAWVAYAGGFERLTGPFEGIHHPLFGAAEEGAVGRLRRASLGVELDLQRAVVATLLGALVGAAGLTAAAVLRGMLVPPMIGTRPPVVAIAWDALDAVPRRFLSQMPFLLAVLFVVGPRTRVRGLLKGLAVLVVAEVVALVPALLDSDQSVALLGRDGPLGALLGEAVLVVGIALAVWLALGGGFGALRERVGIEQGAG